MGAKIMNVTIEILEREGTQIFKMSTLDLQNKPIMWVCSYLVDGLLIDCGHHHAKEAFLKKLDRKEIKACILTHHHEDHYGACHDLMSTLQIPVMATKETAFLVGLKIKIPPERKLVWGVPTACRVVNYVNSANLEGFDSTFLVYPSPGHCKNLISIHNRKKNLLFLTDALIDLKQSVIFNWEDANLMLKTLKAFLKLDFKYAFLENGNLIKKKDLRVHVDYWEEIKSQASRLLENGLNSKQIVKSIFGWESGLKNLTGGDMSRENLIRSLLNLPPLNIRKERNDKRNT
jgi:glyoxylase-like metal-dependent hydrolase (beta-lactamase superfamily II)